MKRRLSPYPCCTTTHPTPDTISWITSLRKHPKLPALAGDEHSIDTNQFSALNSQITDEETHNAASHASVIEPDKFCSINITSRTADVDVKTNYPQTPESSGNRQNGDTTQVSSSSSLRKVEETNNAAFQVSVTGTDNSCHLNNTAHNSDVNNTGENSSKNDTNSLSKPVNFRVSSTLTREKNVESSENEAIVPAEVDEIDIPCFSTTYTTSSSFAAPTSLVWIDEDLRPAIGAVSRGKSSYVT